MSALDKIKFKTDEPSLDNIKFKQDKPRSLDSINFVTDEDMQQSLDNKLSTIIPPTSIPLQSELSLPEQIYQQHIQGQGYPNPKAKGILKMLQEAGKKGVETFDPILDVNPFTGQRIERYQPAFIEKTAILGDKVINLGFALQRIPATILMIAKNKREGKPNIGNVSTKEALINAVKGDPTKPYGSVSLPIAISRSLVPTEKWEQEEQTYRSLSPSDKFFMDAPALLGDVAYGFASAGKILIPATKFLLPASKMGRVAMNSVDNAKQMILEDEELAKIKLDRIAKVDDLKIRVDQIQKDKINIDAMSGISDALKEQKKTLTGQIMTKEQFNLMSPDKYKEFLLNHNIEPSIEYNGKIYSSKTTHIEAINKIPDGIDFNKLKSGFTINGNFIEGGSGALGQTSNLYDILITDKIEALKTASSQLRTINKAVKGAKPELFDKINQLPKDIDALHIEVLADHRLIKGALDDMVKSSIKSTGAEQEGIDQINKAFQVLSKDISKQTKDITSLQSAQSRIDNIKQMIKLSDNMEEQIANQVKRQLYTTGVRGLIKTSKVDEYSGIKTFTGVLKEKRINDMAKVMTHNRVTDWRKLDGTDMESLYDMFKGIQQIDPNIGTIREIKSWVSPEAESFKKLNALRYYSKIENGVFELANFSRTIDRTFGDFLDKFKSLTGKKWERGSAEDDLLSYMLDSPNNIPNLYSQSEVVGRKLNIEAMLKVKLAADEWRKVTDYLKEWAIKEGKLSTDIAGFNALKLRKQILDDQIKVMIVGKNKLTPRTDEYILASAKIADANKELKGINRAIKNHPPLVVENYYSHKGMLAKNILDDIAQMQNAKASGWSFDSLPPYAKNSFAGIAVNVNSPEFMQRLKNGDVFRRDAMAVMREAVNSEARKLILEPIFAEGKAYIDALPDSERKLKLHEMYDALVRVTRGMEHPLDKKANIVFAKASKKIEKTVQSVTGGRLHYVAQTRAFEHFTESVRQLAFIKTLWGNTWTVAKNTFQITQSIATIGSRATLAGVEGAMTRDGMWLLEQLPTFLGSLHPIENFVEPKGLMGWANEVGLIGQTLTERNWNRAGAGLGAIYHALTKSQKNMDDLMRFALTKGVDPKSVKGNNLWNVFRQYVEAGNGKDIMMGANENIRTTQYDYARYATMPLLHSATGRIGFMFTNWPSHYFFSFLPQIWRQLIKGTSTLEVAGIKYKWTDPDRYGIFKYILATAGTYAIGKGLGYDMEWQSPTQQLPIGNIAGSPVPITVSPPVGLLLDIGITSIHAMRGNMAGAERSFSNVINDVYPNAIKHVVDIAIEKQPPQSIIMKTQKDEMTYGGGRTHPSRSSRTSRITR